MTPTEMVTGFSLTGKTYKDLCDALKAHLQTLGLEAEEYGPEAIGQEAKTVLPTRFRWFVAFCVEGGSEGYYVHIGVFAEQDCEVRYTHIGLAKMYTAELAYRMATECQRFLTATVWN